MFRPEELALRLKWYMDKLYYSDLSKKEDLVSQFQDLSFYNNYDLLLHSFVQELKFFSIPILFELRRKRNFSLDAFPPHYFVIDMRFFDELYEKYRNYRVLIVNYIDVPTVLDIHDDNLLQTLQKRKITISSQTESINEIFIDINDILVNATKFIEFMQPYYKSREVASNIY